MLRELGRQVAAIQDADREAVRASERAGESFIRAVRSRPRSRSARLVLAAALVSVVAAALLIWVGGRWIRAQPIAVSPPAAIGDPIVAPAERSIPLRFSDGSAVHLAPGSEASVRELSVDGARVALERGRAKVSVVHRPRSRWLLHAGPYEIAVTGTRFDLGWSPEDRRLALDLWEGSVRVSAQTQDHAAVQMVAPKRLVIDAKGWQLSPLGDDPAGASPTSPSPDTAASAAAGPTAEPTPSTSPTPSAEVSSPPTVDAPDWRALAREGDFRGAYEEARSQGFASLAERGSASELLTLAQVCRHSGHGSEAVAALSRLRERFGGTEEAAIAAFQLGQLKGGGATSAHWFRLYLAERPDGKLAREALGRLLEALHQSGDRSGARVAADQYLARYPSGPHAPFARQVLGR